MRKERPALVYYFKHVGFTYLKALLKIISAFVSFDTFGFG
jgi:hypothetical protein